MNFDTVVNGKISHNIVSQIRKKIIDGELKPGQTLPTEMQLAELFNVSRSSVRDALQTLESLRIINRRKKGGTTIRHITLNEIANIYTPKTENESLKDLIATRKVLEVEIIRSVVQRATIEDIEELENLIAFMNKSEADAADADIAFHLTLARISGNHVMLQLVKSLKEIMGRLQKKTFHLPGRLENIVKEHTQIVSAIRERNTEAAVYYMEQHLKEVVIMIEYTDE